MTNQAAKVRLEDTGVVSVSGIRTAFTWKNKGGIFVIYEGDGEKYSTGASKDAVIAAFLRRTAVDTSSLAPYIDSIKDDKPLLHLHVLFLSMIRDFNVEMTDRKLAALIEKNPAIYGRFAGLIGKINGCG